MLLLQVLMLCWEKVIYDIEGWKDWSKGKQTGIQGKVKPQHKQQQWERLSDVVALTLVSFLFPLAETLSSGLVFAKKKAWNDHQ